MATDKNVKIIIEMVQSGASVDEISKKMDDFGKKAKGATDTAKKGSDAMKSSFIESADRFGLFESQIGQTFKKFYEGSRTAVASMGAVKGAIAATGIGLLVIAVGLLVANWDKLSTSANSGTKAMNGARIEDEKLRESMDKHIISLKNLQIEYDLATGKIDDHMAALRKLDVEYQKTLLDISNETEKKLGKIDSFWSNTWRLIKAGGDGVRAEMMRVQEEMAVSAEDSSKRSQAAANQKLKVETENAKKMNELQKWLKDQQDALQEEIDKRNEEAKVESAKTQDAKNALILASLKDGQEKDLTALKQAYEKSIQEEGISDERKKYITEKYYLDRQKIIQKYMDEESKAEKEGLLSGYTEIFNLKQQQANDLLEIETQKYDAIYELEKNAAINSGQTEYDKQMIALAYEEAEKESLATSEEEKQLIREEYAQKEQDLTRENEENKKQIRQEYAEKTLSIAQDVANSIFQIQSNRLNAEMQAELDALEPKKVAKTKEEKLAQQLEEKKDAIRKKYAKKEQELQIKQTIINGALGVVKAFATAPNWIVGAIEAAAVAATTALQVATIKSQKFALGGLVKKSTGGFISGSSHENGGTIIEAESGEFIVNKRTMMNPIAAQTIKTLNDAGNNGTPMSGMLTEARVAEIAASVVKAIPVYVVETEVTDMQRKVSVRESKFVQ